MKYLLALLSLLPILASAQVKVNALPNGGSISSGDFTVCDQSGVTSKCTFSQVSTWTRSQTTKSDVGLGSVENTALSTWAGSTNLITLGTITTGTWNGTLLGSSYGGSGNAFFAVSGPATSIKTFTFPNASANVLTDNALVTAAQGGTANGFFAVSGPASSTKTFTFPNASANVLTDNALVTVAQGGTNQSTYTDGQVLIGDTSTNGLDKATLTAGTGIAITNGHGSISVATNGTAITGLPSATAVATGDAFPFHSAADAQDEQASGTQVLALVDLAATSSAIGGSALLAGQCSAGTVTVTGATTTMVATASPSSDPDSTQIGRAHV